uniref:Uncharacterized protein LOC104218159 n=1 Tax=Nicotiana sylvestris TaxID=4096 RepID=A0A1U7VFP8_NICSY|nr:PREDICTED: uncharacterized protein LOC104218159 [Nicotiana sylvestris]
MEKEAENLVARCNKCQRYANNMHRPAELLHLVISPWPFMKWGMDIVGPLPQAKEIVSDNRPKFISAKFTDFFQSWKIQQITSAPYHPVANGQAESLNKNNGKNQHGRNPISLVYGTEALIPVEIGEPRMRYKHINEAINEEELQVNLDLKEERRKAALIHMAAQKSMIERYYNRKANMRYFKIGDTGRQT